MSKKLLSEAQMRRFAKLANINPINEMYKMHDRDEDKMEEGSYGMHDRDEDKMEEGSYGMHDRDEEMNEQDAAEEMAMDAEEEAPAEMDAEIEDEAGEGDLSGREEMARDVIAAVADALNIEVDIDGGEEEAEMAPDPMEDEEAMQEEDELMEALEGIDYVPERQEIVNEVAKRVAKRLLEAKKAEAKLQEALGNRRRTRR